MARRASHAPLKALLNNQSIGQLEKEPSGATMFRHSIWISEVSHRSWHKSVYMV